MRITELAIRRPAGMWMVVIFFMLMGGIAYLYIPTDLFPRTNIPYVTIFTTYPGAGAREIETQVINPLEEAVASVSGLKHSISTASEGQALIILEFSMGTNPDQAVNDVQKAVDAAMYRLPQDVKKPIVQKYSLNSRPVMVLVLAGDRPLTELYQLAKDDIKNRLEAVPGVGRVRIAGGQEREIQVEVDRHKLDSYSLTINQVINYLKAENLNVPAGSLPRGGTDYTVRMVGELNSLTAIENLRLPLPSGGTVRLGDIATVKDGLKDQESIARLNGREAVALLIQKQSDAGIVNTVAALEKEIAVLNQQLPPGVSLVVAKNNATFVRQSLQETMRTLVEGVIMCGLVLAFFLREWRSLFTVMLAIPTSIISTFFMMYVAGFTFNIISLMALTLCVGILVDDSIVILENIHRHREEGKNPVQAAIDGRYEIGLAAVAITMQDVVVFLPLAFMQGLVGQFFRQFGLTVVFATLFSLFVSFTLTPMLSVLLSKTGRKMAEDQTQRSGRFNRWWQAATARYQRLLDWTLAHRRLVLGGALVLFCLSISLIPLGFIGSEFISTPDQNKFSINLELPSGSSLERTASVAASLEERLLRLPEVEYVFTEVGSGGDFYSGSGSHLAEITVILTSKKERKRSVWDITAEVRQWKDDYPGVKMLVREEPVAGSEDQGAPVQIEITGRDEQTLADIAAQVQAIVERTPGAVDVRNTWKPSGQPEIQVIPHRLRTAERYVTSAEIAQAVRAAVNGELAGKYREQGKEYDIRVRLDRSGLSYPADLGEIRAGSTPGHTVALKDVATIDMATGPAAINHRDRQRLITITANLSGERPLGEVTGDIKNELTKINLPPGYRIEFFGAQKDMEESFRDLIMVLALSVLLVYMILVILYESFLTPFIRLISLPCSTIGALWALFLTGSTFNIMSLIGLVMMDGLAAKSGTLLIDYTNTLRRRGLPLREAVRQAATTRLRPIAMTACTMIAGLLPTALALAEGAEIRRSMAIVLIGGMTTSVLLTPLLIPAAYTVLEDWREKWRSFRKKRSHENN